MSIDVYVVSVMKEIGPSGYRDYIFLCVFISIFVYYLHAESVKTAFLFQLLQKNFVRKNLASVAMSVAEYCVSDQVQRQLNVSKKLPMSCVQACVHLQYYVL